MADERLINYIKEQTTRGISREAIFDALRKAGWQDAQIEEALVSGGITHLSVNENTSQTASFAAPTTFERQSWISVFFLSLITLGIYVPFWYKKIKKAARLASSSSKIISNLIVVFIAVAILNVVLGGRITFGDTTYGLDLGIIGKMIGTIFIYVYIIIQIVLAFWVRNILKIRFNISVNPIMTFIFGPLYLQTRINRGLEALAVQRSQSKTSS